MRIKKARALPDLLSEQMEALRNLVTNRWFLFATGLYVAGLAALSRRSEFSLSDALLELLIFGVGFSLIAWWTTALARPLVIAQHPIPREMLGVVAYVLALSAYLALGPQTIDSWLLPAWIAFDRIRFIVALIKKLIVFVAVPFALFGPLCGYAARDFGWQEVSFRELLHSHLPVVLVCSAAILAFQYFLGGGAAPLREGKFTASTCPRLAPLFCLVGDRGRTCGGILFQGAATIASQRVVPFRSYRCCLDGPALWSGARAGIHEG